MPGNLFPGAVVLDAALLLMRAAPVLLGVRPPLHPVGVPGFAVIDVPYSMANAVHHVLAQMVASMPGAGATEMLVSAAPSLLMVRPAEVPVREAGMAIVGKVVHDWRRRDVTGLVDNMAWGRHGDGNVVVVRRRGHRIGHLLVDHVTLHMEMGTRTTVLIAAGGLLLRSPEVLPVMVSFVAVQCGLHVVCTDGCAMREEPPQKAQSDEERRKHEEGTHQTAPLEPFLAASFFSQSPIPLPTQTMSEETEYCPIDAPTY
eukprot:CAMPEP_0181478810 /NCGR_PEP_ID=MMETSP1110-20121109/42945_1 /TAXON_ID=174948 /ORGANISM="Symbiodinium sp., Strain CCMP421" /LENGTH=257 /DNA_ID=CAMNT_0023604197 /DNA_START=354 /DNA_END=1128 /DNA_ORIENTATION=-